MRRTRFLGVLLTLGTFALPACSDAPPAPPEPAPTTPTATPPPASTEMVPGTGLTWAEYLDGVMAVLATVHPDGDTVDWDAVAERLDASEVTSESEGYRVAAGLVRALRDQRSYFADAIGLRRQLDDAGATDGPSPADARVPSSDRHRGGVASLHLPEVGNVGDSTDGYVGAAWSAFREDAGACGWIVDLRGSGGDAWLLLQAVAPLLGEGRVLELRGRRDSVVTIVDDRVLIDGQPPGDLDVDSFPLPPAADDVVVALLRPADPDRYAVPSQRTPDRVDGDTPVAVLHDETTLLGGQIAAVAFEQRPGPYRSFADRASPGVPGTGSVFVLADGSRLGLATHDVADRDGNVYEHELQPHIVTDAPLDEAQEWLGQQAACRGA